MRALFRKYWRKALAYLVLFVAGCVFAPVALAALLVVIAIVWALQEVL